MKQGDGFKLGNLYFPGCFCLFLSSRVISLTFPMTSSHSLNMLSVLIEGCEVWLKAVSEFMFPVAYHRWHARTPWEGKLLRKMHCVPWSLQTGFESQNRLLKHFKRWCMPDAMHTEAASVGSYAVSSLLSWSNGSAPSAVVRHLGVWIFKEPHTQICFCLREVWLVVNLPFGERTPGNGLVTSYHSDGRRVELAFLWAGHLKNSDLSISRAQHTLCRCFCP